MKEKRIVESFNKIKPDEKDKVQMLSNILNSDKTDVDSNFKKRSGKEFIMKKKAVAAAIVALCFMAASGTAYAAYKWMNAEQAVEKLGDEKLASYFGKTENEIQVEENDKYRVACLGVISGANISEKILEEEVDKKMTYAVVAVERKDGKPIKDASEFVVSPFIKGLRPMDFNVYSMGGGAKVKVVDGVDYYLLQCDDIEVFADRGVYLAVMDGANMGEGYHFDKKTGEITRNEDFKGLNLLFELKLDKSKADPEAAQEYIDKVINRLYSKDQEESDEPDYGPDVRVKNPEEFLKECEYIEGSERELKPDKEGKLRYSYEKDGFSLSHYADDIKENKIVVVRPSIDSDNTDETVIVWTYEDGKYIGRAYLYVNKDFSGHNDLNNPQQVIRQAKLVKGSEKKLTPDENGIIKYVTDEIDLSTSAEAVKKNGIDTLLFYGEDKNDDEILAFTYEKGEYIGRLYTCSQSITRKAENKK